MFIIEISFWEIIKIFSCFILQLWIFELNLNSVISFTFLSSYIINLFGEYFGFFPPPHKQNMFDFPNIWIKPIPPPKFLFIFNFNDSVVNILNPISVPTANNELSKLNDKYNISSWEDDIFYFFI